MPKRRHQLYHFDDIPFLQFAEKRMSKSGSSRSPQYTAGAFSRTAFQTVVGAGRRWWLALILLLLALVIAIAVVVWIFRTVVPPVPLVVIGVDHYSAKKLPPNSFAREDLALFDVFAKDDFSRLFKCSENGQSLSIKNPESQEKMLAKLGGVIDNLGTLGGPHQDTVVFYVNALGMVSDLETDVEYQSVLLLENAVPNSIDSQYSVSVKTLLEKIKERLKNLAERNAVEETNAIVFLDLKPVPSSVALGATSAEYFSALKIALKDVADSKFCVVTSIGQEFQQSWAAPELSSSVFANFVVKGLAGFADGANVRKTRDGFVSAGELVKYVQYQVAGWVEAFRDSSQTPEVFPNGFFSKSETDYELCTVAKDELKKTVLNEFSKKISLPLIDADSGNWEKHASLVKTWTVSASPASWPKFERELIRAQQESWAGEAYGSERTTPSPVSNFSNRMLMRLDEPLCVSQIALSSDEISRLQRNVQILLKTEKQPEEGNSSDILVPPKSPNEAVATAWAWLVSHSKSGFVVTREHIENALRLMETIPWPTDRPTIEEQLVRILAYSVDWGDPTKVHKRGLAIQQAIIATDARSFTFDFADPRILDNLDDDIAKIDEEYRNGIDQIILGEDGYVTAKDNFESSTRRYVKLAKDVRELEDTWKLHDSFGHNFPHLVVWAVKSGRSDLLENEAGSSLILHAIESDFEFGATGESPDFKTYRKLRTEFEGECRYLLSATDSANKLKRILAVMEVPILTGRTRKLLRQQAVRIMELPRKLSPEYVYKKPVPKGKTYDTSYIDQLRVTLNSADQKEESRGETLRATLGDNRVTDLKAQKWLLGRRRNEIIWIKNRLLSDFFGKAGAATPLPFYQLARQELEGLKKDFDGMDTDKLRENRTFNWPEFSASDIRQDYIDQSGMTPRFEVEKEWDDRPDANMTLRVQSGTKTLKIFHNDKPRRGLLFNPGSATNVNVRTRHKIKTLAAEFHYRGHRSPVSIGMKYPEPFEFTKTKESLPPSVLVRTSKLPPPPAIGFILDCSQTMAREGRFDEARDALEWTLTKLGERQAPPYLALWLFGHRSGWDSEGNLIPGATIHPNADVERVYPKSATTMSAIDGSTRRDIVELLSSVMPVGQTPLYRAINQATKSLGKVAQAGRPTRLVVVTDGRNQQTRGNRIGDEYIVDANEVFSSLKKLDANLEIHAIGYRTGLDEDLKRIVSSTSGQVHSANSLDDLIAALSSATAPKEFTVSKAGTSEAATSELGKEWHEDLDAWNVDPKSQYVVSAGSANEEVALHGGQRAVFFYDAASGDLLRKDALRLKSDKLENDVGDGYNDYNCQNTVSSTLNFQDKQFEIRLLGVRRKGRDAVFRFAIGKSSGADFLPGPMPLQICADVIPDEGSRKAICGMEFEQNRSIPTFSLRFSDWPKNARFAEVNFEMNFDRNEALIGLPVKLAEKPYQSNDLTIRLIRRTPIPRVRVSETQESGGIIKLGSNSFQKYVISFEPPPTRTSQSRLWNGAREYELEFSEIPDVSVRRQGTPIRVDFDRILVN